jgi:BirA family transcriptional regulator, biotin operon repressor / biotin---[acetyl-CoA-carboxylase] ligase
LESTNTTAYQLAEKRAPEWTVVSATIQTQGRGRSGKTWESAKGGLWFSVILKPQVPISTVSLLQFAAANSVLKAIERDTDTVALAKWPNDIMLTSQKLGGILLESKVIADSPQFVVVGIGVNVNQATENLPDGATSIFAATGRKTPLERLLESTVETLQENYRAIEEPGRLISEWWERCQHRSKSVLVDTAGGPVKGVNIGIDNRGRLMVKTPDGDIDTVEDGTLKMTN